MPSTLESLELIADPIRIRLLLALERESLSVAELQEILSLGQSRISGHLARLKRAGLLEDRRSGKNIFYKAASGAASLFGLLHQAAAEIPEAGPDRRALELCLRRREDRTRAYFDALAGKFGRHYLPGRSWQGLAEMLLSILPPLDIADLGAGEGTFSQLLARRARSVIAVDNSEKMVDFGSALAEKHGLTNIDYRLGDLESPPIAPASVDLAFFSQSLHHAHEPQRAVEAAWRILRPGGRAVILDLKKHAFEQARELYAHLWLGFSEVELDTFLRSAGFSNIEVSVVHREEQEPHFETVLAIGEKAPG